MNLDEEKKQSVYDASRNFQAALIRAKTALEQNRDNPSSEVDSLLTSLVPPVATRANRDANLSYRVEDYVRFRAYAYFLQTARLLPPSACPFATDEEYLGGACMGLPQDLSRYALGRATARDFKSVVLARNLVQEIQAALLEFDFRNGPLRRKYDGVKYCVKNLETYLYELSVTGAAYEEGEPQAKQFKEDFSLLVPKEELQAIQKRYEHRDGLRENLIKQCRDGQKAAKNAIYALHRGDRKKANQLIQQCHTCITNQLLPTIQEEPSLRTGSFASVLEEYTEAQLFYTWLFGKDGADAADDDTPSPVGDILLPQDFAVVLEPEEYLGGLCDLAGEVVRFAVKRGTMRDLEGVKLSLHTNSCIYKAMQSMGRTPSGISKKMETLRRSAEKLERMLYEMSLSEATGRTVTTTSNADNNEIQNGD